MFGIRKLKARLAEVETERDSLQYRLLITSGMAWHAHNELGSCHAERALMHACIRQAFDALTEAGAAGGDLQYKIEWLVKKLATVQLGLDEARDLLCGCWDQWAVEGGDGKLWAGGLSVLEDIEVLLGKEQDRVDLNAVLDRYYEDRRDKLISEDACLYCNMDNGNHEEWCELKERFDRTWKSGYVGGIAAAEEEVSSRIRMELLKCVGSIDTLIRISGVAELSQWLFCNMGAGGEDMDGKDVGRMLRSLAVTIQRL